ncbi:thioester reductase domain-containing protein [Mucilaginibacter sp.]|uniref:thioester reductase domain-containing protein n=1 Tax=Mucilaginibacter sp. TaxID=1882438 RepID=UPI002639C3F3|nr:thioester reductase domain-containing protein [Mucilaginibacter sp.]
MRSVVGYLEHWATRQPEKLLFEFRNAWGYTIERHTYRSFNERTLILGAFLKEVTGLGKGERVLLSYSPGLECIAALIACARAGLIGVPVPASLSDNNSAFYRFLTIKNDCNAKALLSSGALIQRYKRLLDSEFSSKNPSQKLYILDTESIAGPPLSPLKGNESEVFFLQYTSGSTGKPRGVIVSHSNVVANAKATLDHVPVGVSWLPQYHDMGLIGYYLFPIIMGGTNFGLAPSDFLRRPAEWIRIMSEVGATYSSSPNFGYEYCLREGKIRDEELEGVDLSQVRVLMNASEPVSPRSFERFYNRFAPYGLQKNACTVAYGLAENTLTVTHGGLGSIIVDRQFLGTDVIRIAGPNTRNDTIEFANCGVPAKGVKLLICNPENGNPRKLLEIGEIRVAGASVTRGYWNNEKLTESVFTLKSIKHEEGDERYLHTGDLGFIHKGSLYVCGRIKDLIIVNGVNYYPDDIESAVENCRYSDEISETCALQFDDGRVVILVEAANSKNIPDPLAIITAIRSKCSLEPNAIYIASRKSVAMTTSGKKSRGRSKALLMAGDIKILASYFKESSATEMGWKHSEDWREQLHQIYSRFGISNDDINLADHGIDSISLTGLLIEIEKMLRNLEAGQIADALDGVLLQQVSLNDLISALEPLFLNLPEGEKASLDAISKLRNSNNNAVLEQMRSDSHLHLQESSSTYPSESTGSEIVLTGATGFLGPFLLSQLLIYTNANLVVLVRAKTPKEALNRIRSSLEFSQLLTPSLQQSLLDRVQVICGDLALPLWGLTHTKWKTLSHRVQTIYHNGALVNYVKTYNEMKDTNVEGTRAALQLAIASKASLHLISSTFIYGWTKKKMLFENDYNNEMQALDFGYAQSKWVSEQLALKARSLGLKVSIYRPSLISVSTNGTGDNNDVAVRMLAFMIRYGIAVDTPNQISIIPADVVAHNIVRISQSCKASPKTLNVTADRYYSMTDLTRTITHEFGINFKYYDIPGFIDQLNRHCSINDPVYPLLDFFNRSANEIEEMKLKRYSNIEYQKALQKLGDYKPCPTLTEMVHLLMHYLSKQKLIEFS